MLDEQVRRSLSNTFPEAVVTTGVASQMRIGYELVYATQERTGYGLFPAPRGHYRYDDNILLDWANLNRTFGPKDLVPERILSMRQKIDLKNMGRCELGTEYPWTKDCQV